MGFEPAKQVVVLPRRQVSRQRLVEMVVTIDQAGQDDLALEVENRVGSGGKRRSRSDLLHDTVDGEQTGVGNLPALLIHRHDERVLHQQSRHYAPPST